MTPDKAGHVVYLQKLGADGDWHTVEVRIVQLGRDVPVRLDVRQRGLEAVPCADPGRPVNLGGASAPVTSVAAASPVAAARLVAGRAGLVASRPRPPGDAGPAEQGGRGASYA